MSISAQDLMDEAIGLGYDALSPRGVREAILASAASGTQLTAQQAMDYAAQHGYFALSDLDLDKAILAALS